MTGDLLFDCCIISALASVLSLGLIIGIAIGKPLGVREVEKELMKDGWNPVPQAPKVSHDS